MCDQSNVEADEDLGKGQRILCKGQKICPTPVLLVTGYVAPFWHVGMWKLPYGVWKE